jgi:hypothetical protein
MDASEDMVWRRRSCRSRLLGLETNPVAPTKGIPEEVSLRPDQGGFLVLRSAETSHLGRWPLPLSYQTVTKAVIAVTFFPVNRTQDGMGGKATHVLSSPAIRPLLEGLLSLPERS